MRDALSATDAHHMHTLNDHFANFPSSDVYTPVLRNGCRDSCCSVWDWPVKMEAFLAETAFKNFLDSAVICHFYPYEFKHTVDAVNGATG